MKNVHAILKPTYYYLIVIAVFYFFRDVLFFPRTDLWLSVPFSLMIEIIMPIVLFIVDLILILSNFKNARPLHIIAITGIPGFLLGAQITYGFLGMIGGNNLLLATATILFTGLVLGSIFGLVGLLLNYILRHIKK